MKYIICGDCGGTGVDIYARSIGLDLECRSCLYLGVDPIIHADMVDAVRAERAAQCAFLVAGRDAVQTAPGTPSWQSSLEAFVGGY